MLVTQGAASEMVKMYTARSAGSGNDSHPSRAVAPAEHRFLINAAAFACIAVLFPVQSCRSCFQPKSTEPPAPTPAQVQPQPVDQILSDLQNRNFPESERVRAAVSLLNLHTPDAVDALRRILLDPARTDLHILIAKAALSIKDEPSRSLFEVFLDSYLKAQEPGNVLNEVLLRYSPDFSLARIASVIRADDSAISTAEKQKAVDLLASVGTAEAVSTLINFLDEKLPRDVHDSVTSALSDLTGQAFKKDTAWHDWWLQVSTESFERWAVNRGRELNQQLVLAKKEIASLHTKLADVMQRLYTATPETERSQLLRGFLSDEDAEVRQIGLDLVERAMGDAVALDETVNKALREHLVDEPVPAIRARVALILLHMGDKEVGSLVASAFLHENDPQVLKAQLNVLARSPRAEAAERIIRLLVREDLAAAAASALLAQADASLLSEAQQEKITGIIREKEPPRLSAAETALLARFGTDADRAELIPLLAGNSPDVRKALAEELSRKPDYVDILLDKANDPLLYPAALNAIAQFRPGEQGTDLLLNLLPAREEQQQIWIKALLKVTADLLPRERLALDDRLAASDRQLLNTTARLALLESLPLPSQSGDETQETDPDLLTLVLRLAAVYLDKGDLADAEKVLHRLDGLSPQDESHTTLLLSVYLRQGRYEEAAALDTTVDKWLDNADWMQKNNSERLPELISEIQKRFENSLDDQQGKRLQNFLKLVTPAEPEPGEDQGDNKPPDSNTSTGTGGGGSP